MKRGRLSSDELARLEQLSARGLTGGRIAQMMNRHPSTICHAMVRHGLRTQKRRPAKTYRRGGMIVREFSPDEDFYIETLRIAGHGATAIAKAISARFGHPRSPHTISMRLVSLANYETEAADVG